MSSWTAAETAYSTHGTPMLSFYIFYPMFGFQRVGDFIWAAADARARGFVIGPTAGRTTLSGERLQHPGRVEPPRRQHHTELLPAAAPEPRELTVQLLGSGTILREALAAAELLENDFGIMANAWSVTSYTELRRDGLAVERWNRLNATEAQ